MSQVHASLREFSNPTASDRNIVTTEFVTPSKVVICILIQYYVNLKQKEDQYNKRGSGYSALLLDLGLMLWDLVELEHVYEQSPFAIFIRRVMSEYKQLYLNDWNRAWRFRDIFLTYVNLKSEMNDGPSPIECLASMDAEQFVDRQTDLIESAGPYPSPKELQRKLELMYKEMPALSKIDFVTYLNCMQAKDLEGAYEALSRFFTADDNPPSHPQSQQSMRSNELALLNMAIMYIYLDKKDLALQTLQSAMVVARNNKNQPCLNYIQSWCNHLLRNRGPNAMQANDRHSLKLFQTAAKQEPWKQFNLAALAELDHANIGMQRGGDPTETFASVHRTSAYNVIHRLEGFTASIHLIHSDLWETYGNAAISRLYANLQRDLLAIDSAATATPLELTAGTCVIADFHAKEGNYPRALSLLGGMQKKYPAYASPASIGWMACVLNIIFDRSMARHELQTAQQYASLFAALAEEATALRPLAELQHARLARREGRPDEAQLRLNTLIEEQKRKGPDTYKEVISYYLEMADIYMDAKDPYNAFPLIMTSILAAAKYHMQLVVQQAKLALAETLLQLNDHSNAVQILEGAMSTILAHSDLRTRSMALTLYAECMMVSAATQRGPFDEKVELRATRMLQTALDGYRTLDDLDGSFKAETLLALHYRAKGDEHLSLKHASTCRALRNLMVQRARAPPKQNITQILVDEPGYLLRFWEDPLEG
ncbi:Anaphase-promoting complex subunit 5 [Rhizophlyctis rosea]|nr:Anaphase-promoting complex subunit 5 [Rhizophlyctis rosea]